MHQPNCQEREREKCDCPNPQLVRADIGEYHTGQPIEIPIVFAHLVSDVGRFLVQVPSWAIGQDLVISVQPEYQARLHMSLCCLLSPSHL